MDDAASWYGQDAATFGDRVAAARDASGMTQRELAKRLGVKLATLQAWENDLSEPRANRLSMMAGLLGVSMMWLMNGEGEGLEAPDEEARGPDDISALLIEMRDMRTDLLARAETLGRMEKRLRRALRPDG
ncbi:MAG: helix-turn-helix transcriptional regulator [Pseudomonadota bacterium]